MPLYDYRCDQCGVFEGWAKMANSSQPAVCPSCGQAAGRLVTAPMLTALTPAIREAYTRNERSAHEPRMVSGSALHSHAQGHTHGHHTHRHHKKRPWMIGH